MRALMFALSVMVGSAVQAQDRWMTVPSPSAMPTATASGLAPVNDIQMYYATYGAAAPDTVPILMIHGGLGHGDVWADQVIDLMRDHLVIVADSRGHGRSTRSAQPYGYDLMASDYLALLDYLNIDKVDLVGWSDGGIIGLDIAMNHPERLNKLFAQAANVTVDGVDPGVMTNPTFGTLMEMMGADYGRLSSTPDQFEAFVAQISEMWMTQPNWSDAELAKITTPTAIVLGEYDEAITRAHTDHMAAVIPGAVEIILPGVSHVALFQAPAEYTAAIRAFLQ